MANTPIILVPGFWLGAWAWEPALTKTAGAEFDFNAFLTRLGNSELLKRLDFRPPR